MATNNWKCDFAMMKKMLNDLNKYVECHDWQNAHHIGNVLAFHLKFDPLYEEERLKVMNCRKEKK